MTGETSAGVGPEWREVAIEAGRILQIARYLASKNADSELTVAALLPSLVYAVALSRAASRVADEIGTGMDQVAERIRDIERPDFDALEAGLSGIASAITTR